MYIDSMCIVHAICRFNIKIEFRIRIAYNVL